MLRRTGLIVVGFLGIAAIGATETVAAESTLPCAHEDAQDRASAPAGKAAEIKPAAVSPDQKLLAKLSQQVALKLNDVPLDEALAQLGKQLGVQIVCDTEPLAAAGIDPAEVNVTIDVRNLSARTALRMLLQSSYLEWNVCEEAIWVTTPANKHKWVMTKVYQVGDLAMSVDEALGEFEDVDSQSLIEVIVSTIEPEAWDELGGPGSISALWSGRNMVLVVTQSGRIHEKLAKLLADLRASRPAPASPPKSIGEPAAAPGAAESGAAAGSGAESVATANNHFACALFDELAKKEGNAAFSPLGITTAMGMIYAGARNQTAEEIAAVMHFPADHNKLHPPLGDLRQALLRSSSRLGPRISIVNGLWVDHEYSLLESFTSLCKRHYSSEPMLVDFSRPSAACRAINDWTEEQTRGKIVNLVSESDFDPQTVMSLVNAVDFEGQWKHRFDKSKTEPRPFFDFEGRPRPVKMMWASLIECRYGRFDEVELIELPYRNSTLAMSVILPAKGKPAFRKLVDSLTPRRLALWHKRLRPEAVEVSLPRIAVQCDAPLKEILKSIGMHTAFDRTPGTADFSGFDGSNSLILSQALHRTVVEVDEIGTKAAAATYLGGFGEALLQPSNEFLADHPFMFLIRDTRTGCILFMGKVEEPERAGEAAEKPRG